MNEVRSLTVGESALQAALRDDPQNKPLVSRERHAALQADVASIAFLLYAADREVG